MTSNQIAAFCNLSNNAVKKLHTEGVKNRVVNSAIWITTVKDVRKGNSGMVDRRWSQ